MSEVKSVKDITSKKYLGDIQVVSRLLKGFAHHFLTSHYTEDEIEQKVDESARKLARIFLGKHKDFPGPAWFSPGQIDEVIGKQEGIDSTNPEERVAGCLIHFLHKMYEIAQTKPKDWQEQSTNVLKEYTYLFLGLPPV